MLPATHSCWQCGDEFAANESAPGSFGDEPEFCSSSCAESASEAETAYGEARYTGAPVH